MSREGARDITTLVAETLPDSKSSVAEQFRAARETSAQTSKYDKLGDRKHLSQNDDYNDVAWKPIQRA